MSDIVERVAVAISGAPFATEKSRKKARAAIAIVLEEAAKVAEAFPARTHGNLATAPYAAAEQAGDEIAAAIRKLGETR